jgi:hypothetical protein
MDCRKPTNTQRFIVNESNHSVQHKIVAFNSMLHRAVDIPMSKEDSVAELNFIFETAHLNGYEKEPIQKLLKKNLRKRRIKQYTLNCNRSRRTLKSLHQFLLIKNSFTEVEIKPFPTEHHPFFLIFDEISTVFGRSSTAKLSVVLFKEFYIFSPQDMKILKSADNSEQLFLKVHCFLRKSKTNIN